MSDLLQAIPFGIPVGCRRLADWGTNPLANSMEAWRLDQVGLAGSLKSFEVPPEGVAGLGVLGESAVGSGAVVAAEVDESATEVLSSAWSL